MSEARRRPAGAGPGPRERERYLDLPTWLGAGGIVAFSFGVGFVALGVFDLYAVAAMLACLALSALIGLVLRRDDGRNAAVVAGQRLRDRLADGLLRTLELAVRGLAVGTDLAAVAGRELAARGAAAVRGVARSTSALRGLTARQWEGDGAAADADPGHAATGYPAATGYGSAAVPATRVVPGTPVVPGRPVVPGTPVVRPGAEPAAPTLAERLTRAPERC